MLVIVSGIVAGSARGNLAFMVSPLATENAPFGRVLVAMVTPFAEDGSVDLETVGHIARHLVDLGADGIVVSGTTGEAPTTSVAEDREILAATVAAVGDRATVIAGVGTNDTRHSIALAKNAVEVGADGLLIVTPYYSKPSQSGIIKHFEAVCEAGSPLPAMLYDIPGRTGMQLSVETLHTLAKNPAIVALKDATGDLDRGAWLMKETNLALYSGDDAINLPWLAIGAVGVVSVVGHVAAGKYAEMVRAVDSGDLVKARSIHEELLPAVRAMMTIVQGAVSSKAALQLLGVTPNREVRAPLVPATDAEVEQIAAGLAAAGFTRI